jgi:hypothetical protein
MDISRCIERLEIAHCGHFDKPIKRQLSALTGQFEFLYLGNKNPAEAG